MLGRENVATPPLTAFWRFYGLEPVYDKMAALVGDGHLDTKSKAITIMERLKSVTGDDRQSVDRKGRRELTNVKVKARFTIAVNELPQFPDSASALRSRLLVIPFNQSFQGRKDRWLGEKLQKEMFGVIAWSLRGLVDLRQCGDLLQPRAGLEVIDSFTRLSSPVKEFTEDRCELSAYARVPCATLFAAWEDWRRAGNHQSMNESQFGERLRVVHPCIRRVRHGRDVNGNQIRHYEGIQLRHLSESTESI